MDDLEKLRRFALSAGVLLFSYVVAGFNPEWLKAVERKEYVPIALVLAAAWGLVRFWLYGFMLARSPWRRRNDLLRRAATVGREQSYLLHCESVEEAKALTNEIEALYPRFLGRGTLVRVGREEAQWPEKLPGGAYRATLDPDRRNVHFGITRRQKVAAWFQDIDYSSPVWVSGIALLTWFYSIGHLCEALMGLAFLLLIGVGIYRWTERFPVDPDAPAPPAGPTRG